MAGGWRNLGEGLTGMAIMALSLVTPFLNDRRRKWGATEAEMQRDYPGDELVKNIKGEYLHAITIKAPAAAIWPWLVQIGQDRGGFYSYELLENMVGCKINNADKIIPEYQHLEVGDSIPMHPSMGSPYKVVAIEPNRALILLLREDLATGKEFDPGDKMPEKYQNMSWLFFLDEWDDGTTRLISHSRNDWNESLGNTISYGLFGPLTQDYNKS